MAENFLYNSKGGLNVNSLLKRCKDSCFLNWCMGLVCNVDECAMFRGVQSNCFTVNFTKTTVY